MLILSDISPSLVRHVARVGRGAARSFLLQLTSTSAPLAFPASCRSQFTNWPLRRHTLDPHTRKDDSSKETHTRHMQHTSRMYTHTRTNQQHSTRNHIPQALSSVHRVLYLFVYYLVDLTTINLIHCGNEFRNSVHRATTCSPGPG